MNPELNDLLQAARKFYAPGVLEGVVYREAPETNRRQDAWTTALQDHDGWRALVSRVQSDLPDVMVSDTTAPGAMAARRCCAYFNLRRNTRPTGPYSVVVGLASVLVPYYHIYRIGFGVRAGAWIPEPPEARPRDGAEGVVADAIARHLEQDLDLKEFPVDYESVRVPDICVRNLQPGQATLLDALFDDDRSNIP